jgi:beta-lactamase regulating signal transducer with metallopeptidase domain
MSAEFFTAGERLLSATVNGVYQGTLVAITAGLTLRLFSRTNAATRHAIWFGVLLFVTALIPAHLLLSSRPRHEIPAITSKPAFMAIALAPSSIGNTGDLPLAADAGITDLQTEESMGGIIVGAPLSSGAGAQGDWSKGEIPAASRPDAAAEEKVWPGMTTANSKPSFWNLETDISLPHSICLCLVSAWVLLAAVRGGLIARRLMEVRRVKTSSSVPSHGLQSLFDRLRDSLAARRNVRLRTSSTHRSAVVLGFVHPVVLLPTEMDQDANEAETELVLRHELAHVGRRDDWGNLAQQLIQAGLFFHPAVWWVSARLSLEREIACDDYVLEGSGRPRAYALTLANVASRMQQCRHLLAPGVSNNNSQLQKRITMILNKHRDRTPRLARSRLGLFTTAAAMLAVLALNAGPRLVLAQPPAVPPAPAEPASPEPPAPPEPPTPPDAPEVEGVPAGLPPDLPEADSGPRIKSSPGDSDNDNDNDNDNDAAVVAVGPSASVVAALPAMPALVSVDQAPGVAPVPPVPPTTWGSKRHMSVEQRLDRIERILEDLQARGGPRGRHHGDEGGSVQDGKQGPDQPGAMSLDSNMDWAVKRIADQAKRIAEQAERAAEAGQRAAEAGQKNAEKAMRDMAKLKSKDFARMQEDLRDAESEGPLRELQALRAARESLDRQREALDRQIHRLEDQNRQNKTLKRRSEDSAEEAKPEATEAPQKL